MVMLYEYDGTDAVAVIPCGGSMMVRSSKHNCINDSSCSGIRSTPYIVWYYYRFTSERLAGKYLSTRSRQWAVSGY